MNTEARLQEMEKLREQVHQLAVAVERQHGDLSRQADAMSRQTTQIGSLIDHLGELNSQFQLFLQREAERSGYFKGARASLIAMWTLMLGLGADAIWRMLSIFRH